MTSPAPAVAVVNPPATDGLWGRLTSAMRTTGRRVRNILAPYDVRYSRIIERMHLAACVPCQYDCVDCSHAGMRYKYKGYQLKLADLREFIRFTEESRYLIKVLDLTGPGEPLLWKHLKEGLRLLHHSPAIEKVRIVSNGLALERLDDEDWNHVDRLEFSLYPANTKAQDDLSALGSHRAKVGIRNQETFLTAPMPGEAAPIPCNCGCTGPMYFDRKVFFYCGPTVFGAADAKGVDVYDYREMYGDIGPDYLKRSQSPRVSLLDRVPSLRRLFPIVDPVRRSADHELCRHCFANENRKAGRKAHEAYVKLNPRSGMGMDIASGNEGR